MQHTVLITFDANGNPVPLSADGGQIQVTSVVEKMDEIRWISPHGNVDVQFQKETPFAAGVKSGDASFRYIAPDIGSSFPYTCTVTTPDGKKHGWPANSKGGGTVEVGGGRF